MTPNPTPIAVLANNERDDQPRHWHPEFGADPARWVRDLFFRFRNQPRAGPRMLQGCLAGSKNSASLDAVPAPALDALIECARDRATCGFGTVLFTGARMTDWADKDTPRLLYKTEREMATMRRWYERVVQAGIELIFDEADPVGVENFAQACWAKVMNEPWLVQYQLGKPYRLDPQWATRIPQWCILRDYREFYRGIKAPAGSEVHVHCTPYDWMTDAEKKGAAFVPDEARRAAIATELGRIRADGVIVGGWGVAGLLG